MTSSCIGRLFCNKIARPEAIDNLSPDDAVQRLVQKAMKKGSGIDGNEYVKLICLYKQSTNTAKILLLSNFIAIAKNNPKALNNAYSQIFNKKQSIDYKMIRLIFELKHETGLGSFRYSEQFINEMILEFEGMQAPESSDEEPSHDERRVYEGKNFHSNQFEWQNNSLSVDEIVKEGIDECLMLGDDDNKI